MKLTVLVDNNSAIDKYLLSEPALSFIIEISGKRILFDTGYSDIFIKNAQKLDIDLTSIDYIVLSHGHNDHTWGLCPLTTIFNEEISYGAKINKPTLIAHPNVFYPKYLGYEMIGSMLNKDILSTYFNILLSKSPVWITDDLVFLGEINRLTDFENQNPVGQYMKDGKLRDDFVMDDSALVYKCNSGIIIITACSHSGICNIIEQAKKVCNDDRILDIIGGFHMLVPDEKVLTNSINYLKACNINSIHPCHCTDLNSKIELSKIIAIEEVFSGLVLASTETKI